MKEMALLSHAQLSSPSPFAMFFAQRKHSKYDDMTPFLLVMLAASSRSHSLSPQTCRSNTASVASGSCMEGSYVLYLVFTSFHVHVTDALCAESDAVSVMEDPDRIDRVEDFA